jgi:hypothetical protein
MSIDQAHIDATVLPARHTGGTATSCRDDHDPSRGTGQNAKITNVYRPWDDGTGLEGVGGGTLPTSANSSHQISVNITKYHQSLKFRVAGGFQTIPPRASRGSKEFKAIQTISNQSKKSIGIFTRDQTGANGSKRDQSKKVTAKLVLKLPRFSHHLAPFSSNSHHFAVTFFRFFPLTGLLTHRLTTFTFTFTLTPIACSRPCVVYL